MNARNVGHGIAVFVALAELASGIAGVAVGVPAALSTFCLIIGVLLLALTPFSYRGSRPAWAVIVSILAVWGIGTFFGAATLARSLHIGLPIALLVPAVFWTGVIALAQSSGSYQEA